MSAPGVARGVAQGVARGVARIARPLLAVAAAAMVTLGLFLVLPLLQAITASDPADLMVRSVDVGQLPEPDEPPPPEPEPEEPEPEEPPPKLETTPQPMELAQLELALNPGLGAAGAGSFELDLGEHLAADSDGESVSRIFSLGELDQRPRVLFQRPPRYPPELLRTGRGGTVRVLFIVDEQGNVANAKVQRASDPAFEKPALEAVRQWKFEPGTRGGEGVAFRMRVPITFGT